MVCSADMLVMGNEVAGLIKRFASGINTEHSHLAQNEIQKVGAGGNYLQESHTFKHFKECWYPDLFERGSHSAWEAGGRKSLADKCRDKVKQILENHQPLHLAENIQERIKKIRIGGEKEILRSIQ